MKTPFSDCLLILFSRYPEPGQTKTRLIPALGAAAAAEFQAWMTEHTLQAIAPLASIGLPVQLQHSGGSPEQWTAWLGDRWRYQPQASGDLGDRMASAFHTAFAAGTQRIVLIGSDCPDLDTATIEAAFSQLTEADIVLGPSTDGGYYLIGLRAQPSPPSPLSLEERGNIRPPFSLGEQGLRDEGHCPDLFTNIPWSTDDVLSQTLLRSAKLGLTTTLLPELSDLDEPKDLKQWATRSLSPLPKLSVIIPARNEATTLARTLPTLLSRGHNLEIIVIDGNSSDDTPAIASSFGAIVLTTPPGRAQQMNIGVAQSHASTLLFLHADTLVPPNFCQAIETCLSQPGIIAGAFTLTINSPKPTLRWVEWGVRWRSHLLQLPYGDQGLFIRKTKFIASGGFAKLPIMEDFEWIQRLKHQGQIAIAPAAVITSARRWQHLGVFKTTLINQLILAGYFLGVSPNRLAQWYRTHNSKNPQTKTSEVSKTSEV